MEEVIPFEQLYPEDAEALIEICQHNQKAAPKDRIKVDLDYGNVYYSSVRVKKMPERNDPCPCGSNKKYKKCCMVNK